MPNQQLKTQKNSGCKGCEKKRKGKYRLDPFYFTHAPYGCWSSSFIFPLLYMLTLLIAFYVCGRRVVVCVRERGERASRDEILPLLSIAKERVSDLERMAIRAASPGRTLEIVALFQIAFNYAAHGVHLI